MNQATFRNVKAKMVQALALVKEAMDMSIPLFRTEQQNSTAALWEAFLREIVIYAKHKSKETGINLINKISIGKIWLK